VPTKAEYFPPHFKHIAALSRHYYEGMHKMCGAGCGEVSMCKM